MSFGVQIKNGSNFIQIDENYQNLLVVASGTLSKANTQLIIPSSIGDDYLIFCRPSNPDTSKMYKLEGSTFKTGTTNKAFMSCAYSPYFFAHKIDVDYVICVKAQDLSIPTTTYGLNVFNTDGTLSFSSDYPLMKITATRHHETTASNYNSTEIWHTPTGGIDNIYALNMWYNQISWQVTSAGQERFYRDYYWSGFFDYPNNRFKTGTHLITNDAQSGTPVGAQYKLGHKTEILGYAI